MKLEPGDLVLVPFPFTDLTATKTRPALVLSSTHYNQQGPDVIVCGVTSNLSNAAHSVLLRTRDMAQGRLPAPSRIKADKIASLQKTIIRRKVGTVKRSILQQALGELAAVLPGLA